MVQSALLPELSSSKRVSLSRYSTSYGIIKFPQAMLTGTRYKYINVASDGTVTWEADPNHTYTVPATCATAATINNTWQ